MLLQRILIASTILKSGRNDTVPFVCSVNIFEDAAHPCIGANVFVGRLCPTKGCTGYLGYPFQKKSVNNRSTCSFFAIYISDRW
jgi:hypothetical protein